LVRRLETPHQPLPDERRGPARPRGGARGIQDFEGHDSISTDQAAIIGSCEATRKGENRRVTEERQTVIRTFRPWIVIGVVCGAVSGVYGHAAQDASALIGTWASPEASGRVATLKFLPGGFFEVEFRGDEGFEVAGRYQVENNQLIITDEGGLASCLAPEYRPARYSFTIRSGELTLDALNDDCDGRVTILERRSGVKRTWMKKNS
jgi:hypothetical protein